MAAQPDKASDLPDVDDARHFEHQDSIEGTSADYFIDPAVERKLLAKIDLFLVPVVMLVYLCCFLDRTNIGG